MERFARVATVKQEPLNRLEVVQVAPVTSIRTFKKQKPAVSPIQKIGYGLVLFAVVFCAVQAIRCGMASTAKLEGLVKQLSFVEQAHQQAKTQKSIYQDKISLYSSPLGIEEMARDRLGMVGQDEVLVRIYPTSVAQR